MTGIKKVNLFGVKSNLTNDVKDRYGDNELAHSGQYCQSCLQFGIRSKLKRRMYKVQTSEKGLN